MPQPGDSGSPILQAGKAVGILSSVMLSNCMGSEVIVREFMDNYLTDQSGNLPAKSIIFILR